MRIYCQAESIKTLEVSAVRRPTIDINKNDPKGNAVSLTALKGKYVLLDVWGSWCGPCRTSHPHLKELYAKYKNQGLEIVGIAQEYGTLEKSRAAWPKAMAEDGIPWNSGAEQRRPG